MIANAAKIYFDSFLNALKPKERLTVSQWADKFRKLSSKTASEPGQWRTSRTPYLKDIMDELSHMVATKKVIVKKSAQVGFTEMGNNWIGYTIDQDPSTIMVVWPALPDVKKNSKLRIDPLIESTPVVRDKISTGKAKDSTNTAMFKDFDGGALILTGANSASGLRSVPSKKLFLDEIDGYPDDVENEGDPIALCFARSRTFPKRKALLGSTPTIKGMSKIDNEFRASDQRYYYMPCPHCGEYQVLHHLLDEDPFSIFDNLHYQTEDTATGTVVTYASYFCKHCGQEIEEHHKTYMLENGKYIKHNPGSRVAGFYLHSVFSPLGWYSWIELCQDYVDALATNDYLKIKTFVNTSLGEVYEDKGEKPEEELIMARRELYEIGTIPVGPLFLTCAVDVQSNRLEVEIHGWGKQAERWVIDRIVLPGSPTLPQVWDDLEKIVTSGFPHVNGFEMGLSKVAIDSGYCTQEVYNFCRKFSNRDVIPIKGRDKLDKIVGSPSAVDLKEDGGSIRKRRAILLWPIGVNVVKSQVYGDLKKVKLEEDDYYPAGYIHFPMMDKEYFLQLTAEERKITKNKKGFSVIEWHKKRERNETLDLFVYNRAAAHIYGIDRFKEDDWSKLESNLTLVKKIERKENISNSAKKPKKKRSKTGYW